MGDARAPGGVLSHGHLFGLKSDVKRNVHLVEEHLVVYPCGHSVVFLNLETRAQQVMTAGFGENGLPRGRGVPSCARMIVMTEEVVTSNRLPL